MTVFIALGIGAGLCSALLFASAGAGSLSAALLMYLAPLPILIVALGWHHLLGLLALSAGAVATSLLLRPSAGTAFAIGLALPAWILSWMALVRRPDPQSPDGWMPVGRLLFGVGIGGALIALGSLAAATGWDHDRYRDALEQTAGALLRRELRLDRSAPLPPAFGVAGQDFVRTLVSLAPALLGAMLALILALNLWLAGKAVLISGRLARPWPDVPSARMPLGALAAVAAAFALARTDGFAGVAATAVAGGLVMAFSLQGLALLHHATRGRTARGFVLSIAYALTLLVLYLALPVLALLGMADTALALRGRFGGGPPSAPPFPRQP